ncbi:DUF3592 domain-containing protein [Hyphomicrobium sp.]|uniref:DUF3592 domain-containing protein n=1 Tax=Hyphomicrobium sp. TaxID=82 RepID=UPI0025BD7B87|nr:DUF3592 domain-containing protein [Hyphomicrobium sp.]MCC7250240.1 hypothetical protein [Hyphomicrobium sp.]
MSASSAARNVSWKQASFDAWANGAKRRTLVLTGLLLLLLAAACTFAVAVMGPRLVREGRLLWFGSYTQGVVENAALRRVGSFKGGAPKYQLTIDYSFVAHTGVAYSGRTLRGDIRTPPDFHPGDATGVFYEAANPANSVAEHNLRTDVYGLLLFLPFLVAVGLGSTLWYVVRFWKWASNRAPRPAKSGASTRKPYVRSPAVKRATWLQK